jgi:hypothetical protein
LLLHENSFVELVKFQVCSIEFHDVIPSYVDLLNVDAVGLDGVESHAWLVAVLLRLPAMMVVLPVKVVFLLAMMVVLFLVMEVLPVSLPGMIGAIIFG